MRGVSDGRQRRRIGSHLVGIHVRKPANGAVRAVKVVAGLRLAPGIAARALTTWLGHIAAQAIRAAEFSQPIVVEAIATKGARRQLGRHHSHNP